jgi:acetylornithine deacetylase
MTVVELLRRLVAFDTTSRNSNLELVRWAVSQLEAIGARIRLTYDDSRTKANLLASFGPDRPGGILVSAHTDVVPVDGQVWQSDPFRLTEQGDRLYGRGAVDMKGFVACCLAAAPRWSQARLERPIHLALTYDEEIGCFGVPRLIADLLAHVPKPAIAIVGEPTGMQIGDRHRGFYGFRTTFRGRAAHSSNPADGVSAISAAAQFVSFLDGMQARHALGTDRTTFNVGQVSGGTNINIVSSHCEVVWEFRPAADADVVALRQHVADFITDNATPDLMPETQGIITIPPLRPEPGNIAIPAVRRLGAKGAPVGLPYGTEGGFFQDAGIPTVICGPGSIEQAHQADEWIAREQLDQACRFLENIGHGAAQ